MKRKAIYPNILKNVLLKLKKKYGSAGGGVGQIAL